MPRVRMATAFAAGACLMGAAIVAVLGGSGSAQAAATPLPRHVFAPYFESWTGDDPAAFGPDKRGLYHHCDTARVRTYTSWSVASGARSTVRP